MLHLYSTLSYGTIVEVRLNCAYRTMGVTAAPISFLHALSSWIIMLCCPHGVSPWVLETWPVSITSSQICRRPYPSPLRGFSNLKELCFID